MAMFRWRGGIGDPLAGFRHMQRELERMTGRGLFGGSRHIGGGVFPPVNVYNGSDDILVQAEVPGVPRDKLDLSITGETLVIRGHKPPASEENGATYQRQERGAGDFARTIVLPDKVDPDRIEASMSAGVLTIRLPKSEAAKPRKIDVK